MSFEARKDGRKGVFFLSLAIYGEICGYQNYEIIVSLERNSEAGLRKIALALPPMYSPVSHFFHFFFFLLILDELMQSQIAGGCYYRFLKGGQFVSSSTFSKKKLKKFSLHAAAGIYIGPSNREK